MSFEIQKPSILVYILLVKRKFKPQILQAVRKCRDWYRGSETRL